jgi:hypothetical protein
MDSLTLAVSRLQSQPLVVGGGLPIRQETSTIATNSATTCTGEEHNFFTKKNTLEKAHNPFKTAINPDPDPAHSDIIISTSRSVVPSSSEEYIAATTMTPQNQNFHEMKESIYIFIDNVKDACTMIANLPRHVENTVQDTLSTVESLDKEMKRVVLDIQNIPNNARSFVGHVEHTWEETHKSVKQLVLDVQRIPDNINSFQHNVRHKMEESQRHGREFVQRIQSIPVEIQTVGQWIENAMGSIEKHLIPSSEYHTMKDTKMHFHHPLAPSPSVQVGAAVNQDKDCNQEKMKMNPQPRSSYHTGTVPRTIADIDPNLDNEVTEALRIANDALDSNEDLGSKERAN